MTSTIKIEYPISDDKIENIFEVALGGGINYWVDFFIMTAWPYLTSKIRTIEGLELEINRAVILNGIQKYIEAIHKGEMPWIDVANWLEDVDGAEDADIVIQYGLFNEVRFS